MTTIGINTLVYMTELANGTPQSNLLPIIASHGITLAEVRREYIASDAEFDLIAAGRPGQRARPVLLRTRIAHHRRRGEPRFRRLPGRGPPHGRHEREVQPG